MFSPPFTWAESARSSLANAATLLRRHPGGGIALRRFSGAFGKIFVLRLPPLEEDVLLSMRPAAARVIGMAGFAGVFSLLMVFTFGIAVS